MPTKTTLILAALFGATAGIAQPALLKCTGESGETLFSDRQLGTECRAVEITPWPVDEAPETFYGVVKVTDHPVVNRGY
jgi:hypothetical protein